MTRHFNTGGPCIPSIHYTLSTERRLPELRAVIDGQGYFVLHAPRQVGKTTSLLSLGKTLTAEGRYAALLVTMETGAPFEDDIGRAEGAILARGVETQRSGFRGSSGLRRGPSPSPGRASGRRWRSRTPSIARSSEGASR